MRDSASSREGLVNELGVKVKRVRAKRAGVVSSQHSDVVRRNEHIEAVSRYVSIVEKTASFRQRRDTGLAEAITCACRRRERKEGIVGRLY